MSILVQCPNPDCKASSMVEDSISGRNVKCKRCGKPFVAKPTFDGHKSDTKKNQPASNTNPFPVLPAEFGRYRILRQLGRGGMGAVYLAQDTQLGRQVALKVPFFDAAESPQRVERFVREARSAAILQHPNICTVFDAGQIDGRPFITMAYIAGTPLEKEIDPDAPMPQVRAAEIVRKIALALQHAHQTGIVHRDLKPANVMMAAGGEPVVMDFGLAKRVADVDPNEAKLTRDGGLLGTPSYMAPEQVKGDSAAVGPATDVYALGVILFEMLTGRTPYAGGITVVIGQILAAPAPPVKEFRPDVDSRLDAICRKAMAKKPADRFKSMTELADTLSQYLKAPAAPPPPSQIATVVRAAPPAAAVCTAFDDLEVAPRPIAVAKKAKRSRVAKTPPWMKWPILAGAAAGLLLVGLLVLWAVGVFKVKTPDGVLIVQVNEPNAEVYVDGARMTVSWNDGGTKAEIHVKPGSRKVEVRKDGFSVDGKELTFKDGGREVFTARLVADEPRMAKVDAPPPDTKKPDTPSIEGAANDDKDFVSLFNGKGIAEWLREGEARQWTVEGDAIIGQSSDWKTETHLLSDKQYADFTLRLEFMVDPGSKGGIDLRALFGEQIAPFARAHPQFTLSDPAIFPGDPSGTTHWVRNDQMAGCNPAEDLQLPAGSWHGLEITVRGDSCIGILAGKKIVDMRLDPLAGQATAPALKRARGRIGFQANTGTIRFRHIKIKELPLAADAAPPTPAADGFTPLFNGKDLTGWAGLDGFWSVKDGVISGHEIKEGSKRTNLVLTTMQPANFELRYSYKFATPDGNSGVQFRSELGDEKAFHVGGYQADCDAQGGYDGSIYDVRYAAGGRGTMSNRGEKTVWDAANQRRSNKLPDADELKKYIKVGDWNDCVVVADGTHITYAINGHLMTDLTDDSPKAQGEGVIALQCHAGFTMEVLFKDIKIKVLTPTKIEPTPGKPAPLSLPETEEKGFVALFNGKNLTGWKKHPKQQGNWRVKDGILIGSGAVSHLFTERGDFKDFHLRAEVRINEDGNSGIYIRSPFNLSNSDAFPGGYEVQILHRYNQPGFLTGSLVGLVKAPNLPLTANEWFTMEIIAIGNELTTKVNNQITAHYVDENRTSTEGHFALQVWKPATTVVQFRKIEVKELTPGKAAPTLNPPVSAKPADPFQAKSVWVNDDRKMNLTVLERKGDKFTALFVVGDNLVREITGTVKDGKLAWLAKDVKALKGGAGGDNQATITSDKDGDLLDFTFSIQGRPAGAFVLRLKPGK